MDKMTFVQGLQFVFIPRIRDMIAQQETLPSESMVAVQAMSEFDGDGTAGKLVSLLSKFDELFD